MATITIICHSRSAPLDGERAEQREQQRAQEVGDQHHPAAAVAVADDAAEQQQRDQRHGHRDAEQRQRSGGVGERVGLPRHRYEERAVPEQRHAAAGEQQPEVAAREDAASRARRHRAGRTGSPGSAALARTWRAGSSASGVSWRGGLLLARRTRIRHRARPPKVVDQVRRLHRVREVKALAELAAEVAQAAELLVEFDALGDDRRARASCRARRRRWRGRTPRGVASGRRNERSILITSTGKRLR